ncbi:MAG: polA 2 [Planctomycetaceae bacterium]|nr:polA 2 [Planctomycetaceae bacterium]
MTSWEALIEFSEIWLVDFEFHQPDGECPTPICMVAYEVRSGRLLRIWADELATMSGPPFSVGPDALFVAYLASAELSCWLALDWPLPTRVLDLYVEFRRLTNGRTSVCGNGLLGALAWFGCNALTSQEKDSLRQLAIRGGPFTEQERLALLDYCEEDVAALKRLLPKMLPTLDLDRALVRGRYMVADARMERTGIPIDFEVFEALKRNWGALTNRITYEVNKDYGVYVPTQNCPQLDCQTGTEISDHPLSYSFSEKEFAIWLSRKGIPWPVLDSGRLNLQDDTFRQMAKQHPAVAPLRELRHTLSQLRLNDLAVGTDGRNRTQLWPFSARTGRNQPSNSKFIFGPSVWLRALIRPTAGRALAYLDYAAQEIAIAAALSRDSAMMLAYNAGDPYLWLAQAGNYAPPSATKKTHSEIRDVFKIVYLAANYGMGSLGLSQLIGKPEIYARELLRLHRERFSTFWAWSNAAVDEARLGGRLWTVFGWQIWCGEDARPTSLRNFPVQANGAEILRLACCLATERGLTVCAPVHDALLIEAPVEDIDLAVRLTQQAMNDAGRIVLDGFELRTDAKIIRPGERFLDPRGTVMWTNIEAMLKEFEAVQAGAQLQ